MKRIIESTEADGLESLLGEYVQLWCLNYIYAGKLVGVNHDDVCLQEAHVVYETGGLRDEKFKDSQPVATTELFIRTAAIESYCLAPTMVTP